MTTAVERDALKLFQKLVSVVEDQEFNTPSDTDVRRLIFQTLDVMLEGISDDDVDRVAHGGYRLTVSGTSYDRRPLISVAERLTRLLYLRENIETGAFIDEQS